METPALSRSSRTHAKDRSTMKSSPNLAAPTKSTPPPESHSLEARIRHDLMAVPELRFSSLVVRRIPDGVCLEGVVSTSAEDSKLCQLVREVAGVNAVLNHLVVCPETQPKKG
jgi:osmotically-inducible protein OsmY